MLVGRPAVIAAEKWDSKRVAEHLGVGTKTVSSYLARGQMPVPDGREGPHKRPWWWSTTITRWERPGQGVGGGPKPRQQSARR